MRAFRNRKKNIDRETFNSIPYDYSPEVKRKQSWFKFLESVSHLMKTFTELTAPEIIEVKHNCFKFDRYRKHYLKDNGCEMQKLNRIWNKDFKDSKFGMTYKHPEGELGSGADSIAYLRKYSRKGANQHAQ